MKEKRDKHNIWLVNQYAVPTSLPGITRHFELFNEILKFNDLSVTFWLSSFNYSLRRFLTNDEKGKIMDAHPKINLRWGWAFPHKRNDWRRMINMVSFSFLFFIKAFFSKKPDVIIASSPQIFAAFAALLISKLFRIRFILEVRDLWPESLVAMGGKEDGIVLKLLYIVEKQLYRGASDIVVLTEHQRKYIIEKGIDSQRITLIPNGIIVDEFLKPSINDVDKARERLNLPPSSFIAMYTGAHGTANSLNQVVMAGQYLAEDEFIVLIGDGPEKKSLIRLKDQQNIKQVLFFDPVPKAEIMQYTALADCGIISLVDNSVFRGARPNKLFDYMALGKPIISTISGEVEHILSATKVGKSISPNDPLALATAIKAIRSLSSREKEEIRERGWNYILSEGNRTEGAKMLYNIISGNSN